MDSRSVAEHLNITPRELRKFLRADPEFSNAGCGGKYEFQAADLPRLSKRYAAYKKGDLRKPVVREKKVKQAPKTKQDELIQDGLPITVLRMHKMTKSAREQRDIINRAREARLIKALKDNGLYLGA